MAFFLIAFCGRQGALASTLSSGSGVFPHAYAGLREARCVREGLSRLHRASRSVIGAQLSFYGLFMACRGGSSAGHMVSYKVEPEVVAELYRRWVMPLTKEVQIAYLLRRLETRGQV